MRTHIVTKGKQRDLLDIEVKKKRKLDWALFGKNGLLHNIIEKQIEELKIVQNKNDSRHAQEMKIHRIEDQDTANRNIFFNFFLFSCMIFH